MQYQTSQRKFRECMYWAYILSKDSVGLIFGEGYLLERRLLLEEGIIRLKMAYTFKTACNTVVTV